MQNGDLNITLVKSFESARERLHSAGQSLAVSCALTSRYEQLDLVTLELDQNTCRTIIGKSTTCITSDTLSRHQMAAYVETSFSKIAWILVVALQGRGR